MPASHVTQGDADSGLSCHEQIRIGIANQGAIRCPQIQLGAQSVHGSNVRFGGEVVGTPHIGNAVIELMRIDEALNPGFGVIAD